MKNLSLTPRLIAVLITISCFFSSCKKDFFSYEYSGIYGDWTIRNISGGYTGGGVNPNFDILKIDRHMRFYVYRNDTLLSKGGINIVDQTADRLMIDFVSDNNFMHFVGGGKIVNLRQDTLILSDNCADCYMYFFVRSEVYINENYIQLNKRLDYLEVTYYPIGFDKYFTSVFFQNENLGFISCFDGSILKTSDGGQHWKIVPTNNILPLRGISFINENTGFAVGGESGCGGTGCTVPGYIMLKTTNSGETWEKVNLPYKQAEFETIKFYDSNFGIAIGNNVRLKTNDGGLTWNSFTSDNMKAVYNLFFLNGKIVYLSGIKGQLFKTNDSGETWSDIGFNTNYYINSVMFLNEQVGYISFSNSLLNTTNGGLKWSTMKYAPTGVNTMSFNSETSAVVFGARTYSSSKWDVWDSYINILVNGKWYGDERVSSHTDPFCLDPKQYFTVTYDNKISVIKITN